MNETSTYCVCVYGEGVTNTQTAVSQNSIQVAVKSENIKYSHYLHLQFDFSEAKGISSLHVYVDQDLVYASNLEQQGSAK